MEAATVTEGPDDLNDRNGYAHPILKRTDSFGFTDDPASRAIAERLGYGDTGCRLKPFNVQPLKRWGFDSMPARVPFDDETRAAVERIGFVLVASLREDDASRHTEDKWRARGQRKERDNHVARFRAALGFDDGTPLNRDVIQTAFK